MPRRATGLAILGLWMALLLTGCNTVEGVGKDVSAAGEALQDVAR